jgi:hypothetical protein
VSLIRLWLLMILLVNDSRIEREMQILVRFIKILIPEVIAALQETLNFDRRCGFIYICSRISFDRVLTEIFVVSVARIFLRAIMFGCTISQVHPTQMPVSQISMCQSAAKLFDRQCKL